MKVHKGDTVLVIAGKDKGAKGKVLQAYPDRNRVLVEGVNRIKKHTAVSTNQRGARSGTRGCGAGSVTSGVEIGAAASRPGIARSWNPGLRGRALHPCGPSYIPRRASSG